MTLLCTDRFLADYRAPSNFGYRVTGSRAALAQYVAWQYGFTFATRFMRHARKIGPAQWLFPAVPGQRRNGTSYRLRRDANAGQSAIAAIVAYAEGKQRLPLRSHHIEVAKEEGGQE